MAGAPTPCTNQHMPCSVLAQLNPQVSGAYLQWVTVQVSGAQLLVAINPVHQSVDVPVQLLEQRTHDLERLHGSTAMPCLETQSKGSHVAEAAPIRRVQGQQGSEV